MFHQFYVAEVQIFRHLKTSKIIPALNPFQHLVSKTSQYHIIETRDVLEESLPRFHDIIRVFFSIAEVEYISNGRQHDRRKGFRNKVFMLHVEVLENFQGLRGKGG